MEKYDEMSNKAETKSYVYILCNKRRNVVYVGSTDDLKKRVYFHKKRLIPGFTKKYNIDQLVYFEIFDSKLESVRREKQIKGYKGVKENALVQYVDLEWVDLYEGSLW